MFGREEHIRSMVMMIMMILITMFLIMIMMIRIMMMMMIAKETCPTEFGREEHISGR